MNKIRVIGIIPSLASGKNLPMIDTCLKSLDKSAKAAGVGFNAVIIAGNKDHEKDKIKVKYSDFIYAGGDFGFAEKNNFAIDKTLKQQFDYYLLINDDAWVEKDFFEQFVKIARESKPDIITPLVFEKKGPTIDSFGIEYFKSGYAKNSPSKNTKTQLGPMSCILIKRSLMAKMKKKYGFCLNQTLYSYLEDVEFSIRARGLGAKLVKDRSLKVHHMVSYSYGRKSSFVMFNTYRNVVWIILIAWPLKNILKHILSIILVQGWMFFYALKSYGPLFYLKVLWETILNFKVLMKQRKVILNAYKKDFDFESVLSKHAFRTYHGSTIW